jgi:hypothetical protein
MFARRFESRQARAGGSLPRSDAADWTAANGCNEQAYELQRPQSCALLGKDELNRGTLSLARTLDSWGAGAIASAAMLKRFTPPLIAFILGRALLFWAARRTGYDTFVADTWSRWDSGHYCAIAESGYEFFSCARIPGYDPKLWCGNTAWMPGYSLLMRGVAAITGVKVMTAGAVLSPLFALAALVVIWNAFLEAKVSTANLLTLGLAAFFPAYFYGHAIFPISMFALLQLLSLRMYADRRYGLAGLLGAAAAFTYSSGLFLAGVYGLHVLLAERKRPYLEQLRILCLTSGAVALGFVAVIVMQRLEVGIWDAYFLVQAKYSYAFRTPFAAWQEHWTKAIDDWPKFIGPSNQTMFVALLCSCMLAFLPWRRGFTRTEGVLALFLLVYWLTPLMLGVGLSIYRAETTLLPAVSLARRLPVVVLALAVFIAFMLARPMAKLFFRALIV